MDMNVLKDFPCSKRFYLTHPLKFLKECLINLRNARDRVSKGYAAVDLWNMNDWFLEVVPSMLRELADRHSCYPGKAPFETDEKWEAWLNGMALRIESLREDEDEKDNPYAKPYYKALADRRVFFSGEDGNTASISYTISDEDLMRLKEKYWQKRQEIIDRKRALAEETGKELFRYLNYLWD